MVILDVCSNLNDSKSLHDGDGLMLVLDDLSGLSSLNDSLISGVCKRLVMGKAVRSLYEKVGIKGARHACLVVPIQCIPVFKYIYIYIHAYTGMQKWRFDSKRGTKPRK